MRLLVAMFCVIWPVTPALAEPILVYEKSLDTSGYGFTSSFQRQEIVEPFILADASRVNEVSWSGFFSLGQTPSGQMLGEFDILFFADDPTKELTTEGGVHVIGLPADTPLYSTTVADVFGTFTGLFDPLHTTSEIQQWTAQIPTIDFDTGRYWIAIRSSAAEPDFFLWSHSASGEDGVGIARHDFNEFNVSDEQWDTQAFALRYTVPEPSTVLLLSTGVFGLLLRRRSTRRR
jgi:hypothetical protein